MDRRAGVPDAAIHHAGAGAFRLLRGAFGTDLPHGELCDDLRHRADDRGHRLQPRRDSPDLAAVCCSARWPIASAPSRCWSAACSCRRCAVATYLAVGQLGEFYALSVMFGLAYGGVMPLYAVLVREYFGARIMGTVFGAVSAFASLGMALGPWPADGCSTPSTPMAGSMSVPSRIGLAAVAVALSFPSAKRPSQPRSISAAPRHERECRTAAPPS